MNDATDILVRVCLQLLVDKALLQHARATVERWKEVSEHPGVVGLRGALISREVDDAAALFLAYDFVPAAVMFHHNALVTRIHNCT